MIAGYKIKNEATARYLVTVESAILRMLQSRGVYAKPTIMVLLKLAVQIAKHTTLIQTAVEAEPRSRVTVSDLHDLIDHLWSNVDGSGNLTA